MHNWPALRRVRIVEALARWRTRLGFVLAVVVFWLARPSVASGVAGACVALVGEGLRFWAAGHLNKSREVTSSGPYRWLAHPLYVGSSVLGAGLAIASRSAAAAIVIALYLAVTFTAAIRTEEASLRRAFGDRYDRYRRGDDGGGDANARRRFSFSQAVANREHRTLGGLVIAGALLLLKAFLTPPV